ncbi:hypothetical protein B9Z55_015739 [Caenorhabditis nigoni]|uniref:Uncharacterized protein n=1 Tax=Caenorhabditis nigoni TaxID=1611254 RepID=A0A2G5UBV4_9PELO|nr:hypothetical protein B9Z55_015739 [Caenorhabditis nigoni]
MAPPKPVPKPMAALNTFNVRSSAYSINATSLTRIPNNSSANLTSSIGKSRPKWELLKATRLEQIDENPPVSSRNKVRVSAKKTGNFGPK